MVCTDNWRSGDTAVLDEPDPFFTDSLSLCVVSSLLGHTRLLDPMFAMKHGTPRCRLTCFLNNMLLQTRTSQSAKQRMLEVCNPQGGLEAPDALLLLSGSHPFRQLPWSDRSVMQAAALCCLKFNDLPVGDALDCLRKCHALDAAYHCQMLAVKAGGC